MDPLNSSEAPPPRYGTSGAYDPFAGTALLFGGLSNRSIPYNSTWEWQNGSWRHLPTAQAPSPRGEAAVAEDPAQEGLLLYGGHGAAGPLGDTWAFENGSWMNLTAAAGTGPSPRYESAMAWDPALNEDILFGGRSYAAIFNDTWAFFNGHWREVVTAGPPTNGAPPGRYGASLVWDPNLSGLLLFGGATSQSGTGGVVNDTWIFENGTWSSIHLTGAGPAPRRFAAMGFDGSLDAVVLFGGESALGAALGDTWTIQGTAWAPVTAPPGAASPSGRWLATAIGVDPGAPSRSYLLLFGGASSNTTDQNDTWLFGNESLIGVTLAAGPTHLDVGETLTWNASAVRGVAPYRFAWQGTGGTPLPAGCPAPDGPTLVCRPESAGPIAITVEAWDASGAGPLLASGTASVSARPVVTELLIAPSPTIDRGANLSISIVVSGGLPPYRYAYAGTPAGCPPSNAPVLACRPSEVGLFGIEVWANDSTGASASANTTVQIVTPIGPDPLLRPLPEAVIAAASAIATGSAVLLYASRRRRKSRAAPPGRTGSG